MSVKVINWKGLAIAVMVLMLPCSLWPTPCIGITADEKVPPHYAPDKSCGPRCLIALMRVMYGQTNWTVEDIYKLIGKKPNTFTTLKDLKIAAEKLGFSAAGYKLKLEQLESIKDYAIIPVGPREGSAKGHLHFILLKEIQGASAKIVSIDDFKLRPIPLNDLQKMWNGYALVLSSGKDSPLVHSRRSQRPQGEEAVEFDATMDFRAVDSGSMLEHTFTIRNDTDQQCELSLISKSCSCIYPKFGKTELEPKEETHVTLKMHVDKPGWSTVTVAVAMEPAGIIRRYAMTAFGRDSFRTSPETGHIEAPDGGVVGYPVRVTYFSDSNGVVAFDRIDSNLPDLSVGATKVRKIEKDQYSIYDFDVKLLYDAGKPRDTTSRSQGELNFVLNTTKGKRFIPFRMTINSGRPKYRLTPEKVFLIASKSGRPIEKKVKVEFLTEAPPANITIETDGNLPLVFKTERAGKNSYVVSMAIGPQELSTISTGFTKGEIAILPEGSPNRAPIRLPVSLVVRE